MTPPVKYLYRRFLLRKRASEAPHSIRPLGQIKSVKVLVDGDSPDVDATCIEVQKYFKQKGLALRTYRCVGQDLNYFGILKRRFRTPEDSASGEDELLVSLLDNQKAFLAEYEATCSSAVFKVGRFQTQGEAFDIVITSPSEGEVYGQLQVFETIKIYLEKLV